MVECASHHLFHQNEMLVFELGKKRRDPSCTSTKNLYEQGEHCVELDAQVFITGLVYASC